MLFADIDTNGSDGVDHMDVHGIFQDSPQDNDAIRCDDIDEGGFGELRTVSRRPSSDRATGVRRPSSLPHFRVADPNKGVATQVRLWDFPRESDGI
jgi:hypothetical protein